MKQNPQAIEKVRRQLNEALVGVEGYLNDWSKVSQNFTSEAELGIFAVKLREMRESLDDGKTVSVLGLWRIMETWPYKNELRQKIVEAELAYERLARKKENNRTK
jgi:hypothetical protein